MKKTYLVELLTKLSSKQMKELSDFVKSPFFNKNESAEKLFEYLRVNHPEFKPAKIEKEFIYHKLFSPAEYNDSFMRMIIFRLTELTEQYLAYNDMKTQENSENMHLINALLELGADKGAQKNINNLEKSLDKQELKNRSYYETRYRLEKFKHIIYSRYFRPLTIKDKPDEKLLDESMYLTSFFLISILQSYRYLLNKSLTISFDFDLDLLDYIIKFLENEGSHFLKNKPLELLYKEILVLKDNSKEDLLEQIKNDLCNDDILLDDDDRKDGLTVISNLSINAAYKGKEEFFKLIFEMDKYLISRDLISRVKGGYFDKEIFSNVVTLGLKLDEVEWVEEFIEKYHKKLAPENQESSYNHCKAKLYLRTKEYDKAKYYIDNISNADMQLKLHARITSIMIYYELGNIEEVLMQIETYRKYIMNDKLLSKNHRKFSANFIKFISMICKARYSFKTSAEDIKKNILECDMVSSRKWLLDKTEEIIQRKYTQN